MSAIEITWSTPRTPSRELHASEVSTATSGGPRETIHTHYAHGRNTRRMTSSIGRGQQ